MEDHHVDRPEVYVRERIQLTGTNRPRAWFLHHAWYRSGCSCSLWNSREVCFSSPASCRHTDRLSLDSSSSLHVQRQHVFGGDSGRVTPVPIPNTEVKPSSADGTWAEWPWESRTPPDFSRSGPASAGPDLVLACAGAGPACSRSTTGRIVSHAERRIPRQAQRQGLERIPRGALQRGGRVSWLACRRRPTRRHPSWRRRSERWGQEAGGEAQRRKRSKPPRRRPAPFRVAEGRRTRGERTGSRTT